MKQFSSYVFICLAIICLNTPSYGQVWTKQPTKKTDSLFAVYTWEVHDDYHSSGGEIILTKKKRFTYRAYYPLDAHAYSEGTYLIKKETLILTSDFQPDNMKLAIHYVDTATTDSAFNRLNFPQNLKGDTLYNTYYYMNGDTSINGHYDPMFPYNRNLLNNIKTIKLAFYETSCSSNWIPINQSDKFIKVTVQTDKNLNERSYMVMDWKFKMQKNKLIKQVEKLK